MQVTKSDIADRLSILRLKQERLPYNVDVSAELMLFASAASEDQVPDEIILELYRVNGQIWDLEADIRQGKEMSLSVQSSTEDLKLTEILQLAEVGRRALAIRNLNAQRIQLKNALLLVDGMPMEHKGDHASE